VFVLSVKVLNIVADYHGKAICILSIVMTTRKFQLYKKLFAKIREIFPEFEPHFIMSDYEAAMRKAISANFVNTRVLGCRFHYSKCLFSKLKSKFGLAAFFRPSGKSLHNQISYLLRQFFALPLLKPHHIKGEVQRLEQEMKKISRFCTKDVARRLNKFVNYFISYWCRLMGASTISVAGCDHKTNNVIER